MTYNAGNCPAIWAEADGSIVVQGKFAGLIPPADGSGGGPIDATRDVLVRVLAEVFRQAAMAATDAPGEIWSVAQLRVGGDNGWDFPDDLVEAAWGIIANVGGGDWSRETPDWQEAGLRWRDAYHATLSSRRSAGTGGRPAGRGGRIGRGRQRDGAR